MNTAREVLNYMKTVDVNALPKRIDSDTNLVELVKGPPLCFFLAQDDSFPYNVVPEQNVSVRFTETESGLFAELFYRSDPSRLYDGPRPKADVYTWKWEDDVETFLEPFVKCKGCTNFHEIMRSFWTLKSDREEN